ncbi:MAG: hypothetical protein JW966_14525 [Anaerolineae bacterium]|nr:hypothetical protein [Anaerolineae bacterium]
MCEIQIRGKLLPELTTSISKHLSTYLVQYGVPGGLLIDVRYCANLSVVRLSALLDTISQPKMPLAVLLATEHDQYVASLLHHTLQHWRQIGFFVKPTTAFHFLTTMALNNYKPTDTNLH